MVIRLAGVTALTAAIGLGLAPGASATQVCSDGTVNPSTVIAPLHQLARDTGLSSLSGPVNSAVGGAENVDGQVKPSPVCRLVRE